MEKLYEPKYTHHRCIITVHKMQPGFFVDDKLYSWSERDQRQEHVRHYIIAMIHSSYHLKTQFVLLCVINAGI